MSEAIITALIMGGASIFTQLIISSKTSRINDVRMDESMKRIDMRIDTLEKTVAKHNNLVERTYLLERDVKTSFTKLDALHEDIQELKTK